MKPAMIQIGNFFFRYRNRVFPLIVITLFALAAPPPKLFGSTKLEHLKDFLALGIALTGLGIRSLVIGYAYIKRGGLNKTVYAERIVTGGMFGVCRNPLYLGNLLVCVGVFLIHGNVWVMLLGIGIYLFIYQCIVLAEEDYLIRKFGAEYLTYFHTVPRWMPKFSNWGRATQGMRFNLRRALVKDYATIALTIIILAMTEGYEELAYFSPFHKWYFAFLVAVILVSSGTTGLLRILKKRKSLIA
jgi:protein-S-isoprenylcysteine O-methyltransferase Ste14